MAGVRARSIIAALLPLIAILALWEGIARSGVTTPFLLPKMSDVVARCLNDAASGKLWDNVSLTVVRALGGFAIASTVGALIGLLMSRSAVVKWFMEPIVSVAFPTPKIALLPIFMLWLGLGDTSKITMIAFSCVFIVIANSAASAAGVDKYLIWSARSLGASHRDVTFEVVLPSALPGILTGMQIALPISMIATLVSEMVMGGGGVGAQLLISGRQADSVGLFAGILEIAVLGTIFVRAGAYFRRKLISWHEEFSHKGE